MAAWLVYGVALRDNKKRDESRKAQLKALAVAPQQHEALFDLAILYLDHPLKEGGWGRNLSGRVTRSGQR